MAKILVAITSEIYVRNYLRSGVLTQLRKHHDVRIITDEALGLFEEVSSSPGFLGHYNLNPRTERRHQLHFNLMMWRYRRKSKTFFYRWLRNSNWTLIQRNRGLFLTLLSYLHWFVAALFNSRGLRIPLMANRLVFPISSAIVRASLRTNDSLARLVKQEQIDVILFPSSAFESVSVDLVSLGQELRIPTICLIDNWDNLSSKTVFWRKPDHIGVWGPQAKEQAIDIHGFSSDQVHIIGTPRFDHYFVARKSPPPSPREAPYGLYVGSAMPFDDLSALRRIEALLQSSKVFPDDFHIVYRPHPWQQKRRSPSDFDTAYFSRISLDPQFETSADVPGSAKFQPDLSYYPGLLLNSRFVVGPLTTMLLEATLCQRPVVALSFYDGVHVNTTRRYFSHFEGMENVPGFEFCEQEQDFEDAVLRAMTTPQIDQESSDAASAHFVYHDGSSYSERLDGLIRRVCP